VRLRAETSCNDTKLARAFWTCEMGQLRKVFLESFFLQTEDAGNSPTSVIFRDHGFYSGSSQKTGKGNNAIVAKRRQTPDQTGTNTATAR
jgi:hypothetical protein